jgi:glyoxylase-like metal-dependent hydrolase (beta-lactamase superfamily II)
MKTFLIETPVFKIDGGAFFGVVPKMIWKNKYPSDENNMCNAACRSILIKESGRLILVDNGIGEKDDSGVQDGYFVDFSENLEENLKKVGFLPEDVTDVVLTHLHFDHCGGTIKTDTVTGKTVPTFPNANYYISQAQWDNALNPNYRERSSYHKKKFEFLKETNKLRLVKQELYLTPNVHLRIFNGHTPGLMLPVVKTGAKTFFFAGDLIPAMASIPLAWVSAYDLFPLTSIEEKQQILTEAEQKSWIMVFQHDYYTECCELVSTPKGIRAGKTFNFEEVFNEN